MSLEPVHFFSLVVFFFFFWNSLTLVIRAHALALEGCWILWLDFQSCFLSCVWESCRPNFVPSRCLISYLPSSWLFYVSFAKVWNGNFCANYFPGLHSRVCWKLLIVCPPQRLGWEDVTLRRCRNLSDLRHSVRKDRICLVQKINGGVRVFSNVMTLEARQYTHLSTLQPEIILDISILGTSATSILWLSSSGKFS